MLPIELRQKLKWAEGTTLVAVETDDGLFVGTRRELIALVRSRNKAAGVVDSLLADRRAAAVQEEAPESE